MDPIRSRQPHPDWPWRMQVGGDPPEDAAHHVKLALEWLSPDGKGFVKLYQQAPHDPEQYWYLQCLVAAHGPNEGQYVVDCGYPEGDSSVLLERYCADLEEVFRLFRSALGYGPVNLSGFVRFVRQKDGSWCAADDAPL